MELKLALTALSIATTGLAGGLTNPASATVNQNFATPVVFISQPTESLVQAEKLEKWEKQLHQRLGLNTEFFAQASCSSTVSHSPDADDSDID
ncbi:hypothetical protein A6769_34300 [Nostoc punctiforme NIES-2108]|uniref:Uncharacterized protein n=1 Tax=Nostoc punctiforme NIES-2108 TaxID=1356359 RepID=A0A367R2F4_NOSPU|nr:hypothetical protein A6769_34300 [Nostoc punctiforme NIES-2108]